RRGRRRGFGGAAPLAHTADAEERGADGALGHVGERGVDQGGGELLGRGGFAHEAGGAGGGGGEDAAGADEAREGGERGGCVLGEAGGDDGVGALVAERHGGDAGGDLRRILLRAAAFARALRHAHDGQAEPRERAREVVADDDHARGRIADGGADRLGDSGGD